MNSYVKPPTNNNPFGDPYPSYNQANSYGKYPQQSNSKIGSSNYEKPTPVSNSKNFGSKIAT